MKADIYVDELPRRCIDCQFCMTIKSEPDDYGSMLFSSDEWDTYNKCSLTNSIVVGMGYHCPLKLKPKSPQN